MTICEKRIDEVFCIIFCFLFLLVFLYTLRSSRQYDNMQSALYFLDSPLSVFFTFFIFYCLITFLFLGVIVSVGGGMWNHVLCLLSSAGSLPLKMSQEVTWANEMNFGPSASVSVRQDWLEDEKRCTVFILAEKMARGKMWYSLLIRRQGGVSRLWVWDEKWEDWNNTFNVRNSCEQSYTSSVSPNIHTHTHTSHKHLSI